jgi:hypothetical protein
MHDLEAARCARSVQALPWVCDTDGAALGTRISRRILELGLDAYDVDAGPRVHVPARPRGVAADAQLRSHIGPNDAARSACGLGCGLAPSRQYSTSRRAHGETCRRTRVPDSCHGYPRTPGPGTFANVAVRLGTDLSWLRACGRVGKQLRGRVRQLRPGAQDSLLSTAREDRNG